MECGGGLYTGRVALQVGRPGWKAHGAGEGRGGPGWARYGRISRGWGARDGMNVAPAGGSCSWRELWRDPLHRRPAGVAVDERKHRSSAPPDVPSRSPCGVERHDASRPPNAYDALPDTQRMLERMSTHDEWLRPSCCLHRTPLQHRQLVGHTAGEHGERPTLRESPPECPI